MYVRHIIRNKLLFIISRLEIIFTTAIGTTEEYIISTRANPGEKREGTGNKEITISIAALHCDDNDNTEKFVADVIIKLVRHVGIANKSAFGLLLDDK